MKQDCRGVAFSYFQLFSGVTEIKAAWVYLRKPKMVTPLGWCPKIFNCVTLLSWCHIIWWQLNIHFFPDQYDSKWIGVTWFNGVPKSSIDRFMSCHINICCGVTKFGPQFYTSTNYSSQIFVQLTKDLLHSLKKVTEKCCKKAVS